MKKFKAIDLYSGIGGWTLGLKLANIEVVSSFEWWDEANHTHNINFNKNCEEINIRELNLKDLPKPKTIQFVVGSPPCTQFSYANRGGKGNLADGLKDIAKFLEVVAYLKPKYWAMENVPRVAKILEKELAPNGSLSKFKKLFSTIEVVDSSNYGVPQARKRMIAGNFPYELFKKYSSKTKKLTLGETIKSLKGNSIIDPIYGIKIKREDLIDHEKEQHLNEEEERMNRDAKTFHPVYNNMAFPENLEKPSRTVTATCTRVSRESIIVPSNEGKFRRLTIRERGLLQSFPITYQYYGRSYSSRIKMIGNAIPPVLTFFLAQSMLEIPPEKVKLPKDSKYKHPSPKKLPPKVNLDVKSKNYHAKRAFRAAIPNLRFGSGVRFDLSNEILKNKISWKVGFYYGNSKNIQTIDLNQNLFSMLLKEFPKAKISTVKKYLSKKEKQFLKIDKAKLQQTWIHKSNEIHPYKIVDDLGKIAEEISHFSSKLNKNIVLQIIERQLKISSNGKIKCNSDLIFTGLLIGSWFNNIINSKEMVSI